jgi:hypothetical protein
MREDGTQKKGAGQVESDHGEGRRGQGCSATARVTLNRCKLPEEDEVQQGEEKDIRDVN